MEGRGFVSCFAWAFAMTARRTVFISGFCQHHKGCGVSAFVLWRGPLVHHRQLVVQLIARTMIMCRATRAFVAAKRSRQH
jgi:hypothetical protein